MDPEGAARDRAPQPRHAAHREPPAAPRARLRPGARGRSRSPRPVARDACTLLEVDEHGFDEVDRKLLLTIIDKFGGGPVGVRRARRRDQRGDGRHRGHLRAVPAADRLPRPHAARPHRHAPRLRAFRAARFRTPALTAARRSSSSPTPVPVTTRPTSTSTLAPASSIAQEPLAAARRLAPALVLDRQHGRRRASRASATCRTCLRPGDLLVANRSRVFPARLLGRARARRRGRGPARARPRRRALGGAWCGPAGACAPGDARRASAAGLHASSSRVGRPLRGRAAGADRRARCARPGRASVDEALERCGHVPLPPYIRRADAPADRERYQTVYAREPGSVAAPTAGLHFTRARSWRGSRARGVGARRDRAPRRARAPSAR